MRRTLVLGGDRRWFWVSLLIAGYLVQLVFRVILSKGQDFPTVHPDEDLYLIQARVLTGGSSTYNPLGQIVPGGYPLLVSPAFLFSDNAVTIYHNVILINSLINALTFPLAFVAARRMGLSRPVAYGAAAIVGFLPPVVFYGQYAMTDAVYPTLFLAWILCLHSLLTEEAVRRRTLYGVATGLLAGYMMATHDRGGVIVAATGLALVVAFILRWAPRKALVAAVVAIGVVMVGSRLVVAYLTDRLESDTTSVGTAAIKGFLDPDQFSRLIVRIVGQFWYFSVASWGIGALGLAVALWCVFSSRFPRSVRVVSAVALISILGVATGAAAALPDGHRIDHFVYARYLAPLTPVFFLAGVTALVRMPRRRLLTAAGSVAVLTALAAVGVLWIVGDRFKTYWYILWTLPDSSFLANNYGHFQMYRSTAVAVGILVVCVALTFLGRKVLVAGAVALAAFAAFASVTITEKVSDPQLYNREQLGPGFLKVAGIKPGDNVVFDDAPDWTLRATQAFMINEGRVWMVDVDRAPVPPAATVVVTVLPEKGPVEAAWPKAPAGWHVVATDKDNKIAVWRR